MFKLEETPLSPISVELEDEKIESANITIFLILILIELSLRKIILKKLHFVLR